MFISKSYMYYTNFLSLHLDFYYKVEDLSARQVYEKLLEAVQP